MVDTVSFQECLDSSLVKAVALSDTTTSGTPNVANDLRIIAIVVADVDVDTMCISVHFK